jgi:Fur family ferric uptake transcriptional regulator
MLTGEEWMNGTAATIFRDFIVARGLNMSRQRILVLESFLSAEQQITADDLFTGLRSKQPALGRTTVYRTLKLMVECGIARMIVVDGTCRYERHHPAL